MPVAYNSCKQSTGAFPQCARRGKLCALKTPRHIRTGASVRMQVSVRGVNRTLSNAASVATSLFPVWIVCGAISALLHPPLFLWFNVRYIPPTLAAIMLGMGLTIEASDFVQIAKRPLLLLLGACAQFSIMPLLATLFSNIFALPLPLAVGTILVGTCPGGAASNIVCYIAQADVPYSVLLTLTSTLLSVIMIPLLMKLLAGTLVPISPLALFISTAQVVVLPLLLGALIKKFCPQTVHRLMAALPLLSVLGVTIICASIVASSADILATVGSALLITLASVHAAGGLLGYVIARVFRLSTNASRTMSIEVMMQNSSLAVSLATAHFANPLTAIPGAISASMHSIFGSLLAAAWRLSDRRKNRVSSH